jgi:hypothetical protein
MTFTSGVNGHMICNNCRYNVSHCPSCRQEFNGTRNFFAENFLANCSQSCRYSKDGCQFLKLKGDNMRPHEQQCMFRYDWGSFYSLSIIREYVTITLCYLDCSPIECIVTPCGEEVTYRSLLSHLITDHKILGSLTLPAQVIYEAREPIVDSKSCLKLPPSSVLICDN